MQKFKRIMSLVLVITLFTTAFTIQNAVRTQAKTFKQTGGYSTSLSTKKDKSEQYYSYAKKLVFKGNKFTLYGSMHYTKSGDVYSSKIYKRAKRTYIIASNCKYIKMNYNNGKMTRKKITKKKLKKLALPLDKGKFSNRTLAWKIQGGKVVELEYRDY